MRDQVVSNIINKFFGAKETIIAEIEEDDLMEIDSQLDSKLLSLRRDLKKHKAYRTGKLLHLFDDAARQAESSDERSGEKRGAGTKENIH